MLEMKIFNYRRKNQISFFFRGNLSRLRCLNLSKGKSELTVKFACSWQNSLHVYFAGMLHEGLFKVCFIASYIFFSSFGPFVNTTSVKILLYVANHSPSHFFFISSYESKRYSADASPIDSNKC